MTTFGIEIEIDSYATNGNALNTHDVARALLAHGVTAYAEGYNHNTRNYWKVTTDGSCGLEIVSPVLDPRNGDTCYHEIVKVCTALNSIGAKVTSKCGLHVHLYVADKSVKTVAKFVGMYIRMEHLMDLAMPKSRRGNTNQYCRSLLASWDATGRQTGYGRHQSFDQLGDDDLMARANHAIAATRRARSITTLKTITNFADDRYTKLNLMAFSRQGTIEVRHHSGTTNAKKIIMWVRFLQSMLRRAESSTFVRNLLHRNLPVGTAWHALWCMDDQAACTWFRKRLVKFAQLEQQVQDEDLVLMMSR
jgi:hypothetical protein